MAPRRLFYLIIVYVAVLIMHIRASLLCKPKTGDKSNLPMVVVDTDPGIDDAMAILMAVGSKNNSLLGITTVRGNAEVPHVIINTFKILQSAGIKDVNVHPTYNYGLVTSPIGDKWFGEDGLGDLPFHNPPSATLAQMEHSALYLARIVHENPGKITIVALGPLTNLALALHFNPNILKEAKEVIILGGSIRGLGNVAPGIEFNFFVDPSAAAFVLDRALDSGVLVTLVPMDTVTKNPMTWDWRWNTLGKLKNAAVKYMDVLEKRHLQLHPFLKVYTPYDSYAMSVALNKGTATNATDLYGFVEDRGERTNGALLIDYLNITSKPANLHVITDINVEVMKKTMLDTLSNYK